jgi:uncharacterized protein (DUF486 family)
MDKLITASTSELKVLIKYYLEIFPRWTFPYIPFGIAGFFQVLAWTSGSSILIPFSLVPRIFLLWGIAFFEYLFSCPTINAGVEVFGENIAYLVAKYHMTTLVVFIIMNTLFLKNPFKLKYLFVFLLIGFANYITHFW